LHGSHVGVIEDREFKIAYRSALLCYDIPEIHADLYPGYEVIESDALTHEILWNKVMLLRVLC
jgi:hypothetical protein